MLDKEQLGNNPFLLQLISWIDRKTELNVPKDDDLKKFIEKYYDCDEIVAVWIKLTVEKNLKFFESTHDT
mgnify:CR=1 FL=1